MPQHPLLSFVAFTGEGLRIVSRKFAPFKKYSGNDEQICQQIVSRCFNGTYFQTSCGHFTAFYCRDFGIVTQALIELGYTNQVRLTLDWALSRFLQANKITTTITRSGICIDLFAFAPDSMAFLLKSLAQLSDSQLTRKYHFFLQQQLVIYYEKVWDQKNQRIKKGNFSSMRDHAQRNASCYDLCMIAQTHTYAKILDLRSPFEGINFTQLLLKHYWTGTFFLNDLSGQKNICADAQIFPFYCGVVQDKKLFRQIQKTLDVQQLTSPFPLRYERQRSYLGFWQLFANDYETNTVWMHLGLCYLHVLSKFDHRLLVKYIAMYKQIIEKQKNFLEVFWSSARPYSQGVYNCDESMIWAAQYLRLKKIAIQKTTIKKNKKKKNSILT